MNQYKALDTRCRNWCHRPKFNVRFQRQFFVQTVDARLLTLLTAFGPRRQSRMLEVVHPHKKTLAPESGIEVMAPISGAGYRSVCQGPKSLCNNITYWLRNCSVAEGLMLRCSHTLAGKLSTCSCKKSVLKVYSHYKHLSPCMPDTGGQFCFIFLFSLALQTALCSFGSQCFSLAAV